MLSSNTIFRVALFLTPMSIIIFPTDAEDLLAIDFTTDYNSDPVISKYKMNYVKISTTNTNESWSGITFCLRIKLYTTIIQCIFRDSGIGFKFVTEKYGFLLFNKVWIMFKFKKETIPLKWYHVCVSYESGYVVMILDGDTLINEEFDSFKSISDTKISINETFTLGTCLGTNKGPLESITRGIVTDFNIWGKAFSVEEMQRFTTDCRFSINDATTPPIIFWKNLNVIEQGMTAKNKVIALKETCGTHEIKKTSIILPFPESYKNCKKMCQNLGGNLPLPKTLDDTKTINMTLSEKNRKDKNGEDRLQSQCSQEFWVPIIQKGMDNSSEEYIWVEDTTDRRPPRASYLPWMLSQPNGQDLQQCVTLSLKSNGYGDLGCERKYCCLCEFEGEVNFHLHGMPDTSDTDTHYIFVPQIQNANELIFIGYKRYQISWKSEQGRWLILDRSDLNNTIGYHNITQEKVVVGKYEWNLYPDDKSTNKNERQLPLKFSKV